MQSMFSRSTLHAVVYCDVTHLTPYVEKNDFRPSIALCGFNAVIKPVCYTPSFFLLHKSNTIDTQHFDC